MYSHGHCRQKLYISDTTHGRVYNRSFVINPEKTHVQKWSNNQNIVDQPQRGVCLSETLSTSIQDITRLP